MRHISEVTRVRSNRWIKVQRASGEILVGVVVAHHDRFPARHTIKSHDGKMHVVNFPEDILLKMSNNTIPDPTFVPAVSTPVLENVGLGTPAPDTPALPILEVQEAVREVRKGHSFGEMLLAFAFGCVFGSLVVVLTLAPGG